MYTHRILPRFDLCHPTGLLDVFPLRQNASKTPKWVRSGAVAGDGQHCSRHDVDPGRGSGSPREASAGPSSVPRVCSLPFGAPMPRRHGSSMSGIGCIITCQSESPGGCPQAGFLDNLGKIVTLHGMSSNSSPECSRGAGCIPRCPDYKFYAAVDHTTPTELGDTTI